MKNRHKNQGFTKKLIKINNDNIKEIDESFNELKNILSTIDPIKLLSQLQLTYLLVPDNKFYGEDSEQESWLRKIEFLAGMCLSQSYPKDPRPYVDGSDLELIEKALDRYFTAVTTDIITSSGLVKEEDMEIESILKSAKLFSFYVRGESYQHQLSDILTSIYKTHENWFKSNLGFTITDALRISEAIISEYNNRINLEKKLSLKRAKEYVKENPNGKKDYLTSVGCYFFFGESDRILSFSLDELITFSGFPESVCKAYITRLSQKFGYRNPKFPNSFEKGTLAPWDYNTLYEKPIIEYAEKYFVPMPSLFYEVLYQTFYYDLINDKKYWDSGGSKIYANSLEEKTAEYLKRVFPKDCIYLNPEYPDGTEMCDVLVLYDGYILIFQDKTKRMQYTSLIGKSIETIKSDITKGIKESFDQAIKAKEYIKKNEFAEVVTKKCKLSIDSRKVSNIFPISVTLDSYQNFTTKLSNTNHILKVLDPKNYPWAVSLSDLGVITEILNSPVQFLHYISRRMTVENAIFQLMADEIDLLGMYLSHGIYFENGEFDKYNGVSFSGSSENIDRYIFEKHETNLNPIKPHQKSPKEFNEYIQDIASSKTPYCTDCAMKLLDLRYEGRQNFIKYVDTIKTKINKGNKIESFSFVLEKEPVGYCFIGMAEDTDLDKLYKQLFSFSVMKKYTTKCKDWVAFGWVKNSNKHINLAIYLSFDWKEDKKIEEISKQYLKTGEQIKIK